LYINDTFCQFIKGYLIKEGDISRIGREFITCCEVRSVMGGVATIPEIIFYEVDDDKF
jgi:hypothetical protein